MTDTPGTAAGGITTPDTCPTCGHEVVVRSDPVDGTSYYEPVEAEAVALADNPELDATDGAHPAWWRGCDYGYAKSKAEAVPLDVDRLARALWNGGIGWVPPMTADPIADLRRLRAALARLDGTPT
jgi:hypothetical protein